MDDKGYKTTFPPLAENVREIKFGGAWFEVGIDCQKPDEPGVVTHPDNFWIDSIKIGGVWWGAQDVLSEGMRACLDDSLRHSIADEYKAAA